MPEFFYLAFCGKKTVNPLIENIIKTKQQNWKTGTKDWKMCFNFSLFLPKNVEH